MMDIVFKALSSRTRREILDYLKESDMTATEISEKFDVTPSTISSHLSTLKAAGLISCIQKKTTLNYSLNKETLKSAWDWILDFEKPLPTDLKKTQKEEEKTQKKLEQVMTNKVTPQIMFGSNID
jgi:ArsR family transcriptional regulator, arsenate/arsenite/antimonite-responsive transcriptional repressor